MAKYDEITLEVGFWDQEGLKLNMTKLLYSYNEIDIMGRLIAQLEICGA